MRLIFATIVLSGLPAVVLAQSPAPAPAAVGTLPPIGLPLPPIGLPLPSIGLPPAGDLQPGISGSQSSQTTTENRQGARRRLRLDPTVVYFIPIHGWGYSPPPQAPTPGAIAPDTPSIPRRQESPTGRLRLDIQPDRDLQLYVDRYYVGTSDDFNGELELEAGAHEIEIRAAGYETLTFEVKIASGRSIRYRGTLKTAEKAGPSVAPVTPDTPPVTPAPVTPATPTTFYYIPGCYIGNVPPEDVVLPATCDRSRLITRKPEKPQKD